MTPQEALNGLAKAVKVIQTDWLGNDVLRECIATLEVAIAPKDIKTKTKTKKEK